MDGVSSDSSLAELVERLTRDLEAGKSIDVDELVASDKAHAEVLRDLLPALRQLARLGAAEGKGGERSGIGLGSSGRERVGEFRLVREIGRGGMGIVYEAEQESLGRRVALKMLANAASASERALQRFQLEVQAAAQLQHPNIVPIHVVGTAEGLPYYAMQLIDGRSLADLLRDLRRWTGAGPAPEVDAAGAILIDPLADCLLHDSFDQTGEGGGRAAAARPESASSEPAAVRSADYHRAVARIGMQAAEALECAHERGIIHRDIKPANLLLDRRGNAWVGDFGLARIQGDEGLTHTGELVGTLRYMSPEQVSREPGLVDRRTDVYSLGVTLYEMLTLRPAIQGSDSHRMLRTIAEEEPPPVRTLVPEVPRELATVVARAMAKDPGARYATARELADDLGRFLQGRPVLAKPIPAWSRSLRRAKRGLGTAAVIVLAVASMILAVQSYRRGRGGMESPAVAESRRTSAALALDRGIGLADRRRVGRGLLWMQRCLELAPEDAELARVARSNLAAWGRRTPVPKSVFACGTPVAAMAPSPDDRTLAVIGEDGVLSLWDLASGQRLASAPTGHLNDDRIIAPIIMLLQFDASGRFLVSGGSDRRVQVWQVNPLRPVGPPIEVSAAAVTPAALEREGSLLVSIDGDGVIRRRRMDTGEVIGPALTGSLNLNELHGLCIRPAHDQVFVHGRPGASRIWDAATGRPTESPLKGDSEIFYATFSGDGRRLAQVEYGGETNVVVIRDPDDGRVLARSEPIVGSVSRIQYGPAGRRVAVLVGDGTPYLIDAETGKTREVSIPDGGTARGLAFSPDAEWLITWGDDGTVRLFEADTGRPRGPILEGSGPVGRAGFAGDARMLVIAGHDGVVRVWDMAPALAEFRAAPQAMGVFAVDFSPDGRLLACDGRDGAARVFDTETGRPAFPPLLHGARVRAVRFSPDGRLLATGGDDRMVRIWDAATGTPVGPPLFQPAWVMRLLFSPDGRRLLVGTTGGSGRLWDLETSRPIGPVLAHPMTFGHEIRSVAFSPDGRVAITGTTLTQAREATLGFWDASTGESLAPFARFESSIVDQFFGPGPDGALFVLEGGRVHVIDMGTFREVGPAFGRDLVSIVPLPAGRLLAGGSDRTARIWDVATGRPVGPVLEHEDPVHDVAASPDGTILLTLSGERLRFWDAATGKPLGPRCEHRRLSPGRREDDSKFIGFGPDGRSAFSVGNTVLLWDTPQPASEDGPRARFEGLTGMALGESGDSEMLDPIEWNRRLAESEAARHFEVPDVAEWHDRRGAECARLRRHYSAAWHLDHLVANEPDDGVSHARRAIQRRFDGDSRGADDDWRLARSKGPEAAVRVWETFEALERLAAANHRQDRDLAAAQLRRLADLIGEDPALHWRLGEAEAVLGRYREARTHLAAFLADADRSAPVAGGPWAVRSDHAILCALDGDLPAYRAATRRLLERTGPSPSHYLASVAAWTCSLEPGGADPATITRLADGALSSAGKEERAELLAVSGAALHRAGRSEEAVGRLEESERLSPEWRPQAWAFLALANHSLGRTAEARRWLVRLRERPRSTRPEDTWNELEIALLFREAESVVLLDPAFPARPFAP